MVRLISKTLSFLLLFFLKINACQSQPGLQGSLANVFETSIVKTRMEPDSTVIVRIESRQPNPIVVGYYYGEAFVGASCMPPFLYNRSTVLSVASRGIEVNNLSISKRLSIVLDSSYLLAMSDMRGSNIDVISDSITSLSLLRVNVDTFLIDGRDDLPHPQIDHMVITNSTIGKVSVESGTIRSLWLDRDTLNELSLNDSHVIYQNLKELKNVVNRFICVRSDFPLVSLWTRHSQLMFFDGNVYKEEVAIDSINVDTLIFNSCSFDKLSIGNLHLHNKMSMARSHFKQSAMIAGVAHRGSILDLSNIQIENNAEIDLRYLSLDTIKTATDKIRINLYNSPIDHIHLDWSIFSLNWDSDSSYDTKTSTYQALYENFEKRGQTVSLELLDKEYQHFRYTHIPIVGWIWDRIVWLWWDYGYSKARILLWIFLLPFLWALIVYPVYMKLHYRVYAVSNFNPTVCTETHSRIRIFFKSLTYVSVIFFALSIKFEKLYYDKGLLLLLFVLIYLNGIFCIFFMVNFLLKS